MHRKIKYLTLGALVALALFALASCDGGGSGGGGDYTFYDPETLTVNFYADPDEPPVKTYTVSGLSGEELAIDVWENAPVIEREGYFFHGYTLRGSEFYPLRHGEYVMLRSQANLDKNTHIPAYDRYYSLYYQLQSNSPVSSQTINLYAWLEPNAYRLEFAYVSGVDIVKRDNGDYSHYVHYGLYYGTVDYMELAPDGYTSTQRVIGWETEDGTLIFDFAGRPVLGVRETFELFKDSAAEYNGSSFYGTPITLYPVLDDKFSIVTFDFGNKDLENEYFFVYEDGNINGASYPWAYHDGKLTAGWSLSTDSLVLPEGEITEDITLYPVWKNATALTASYGEGKSMPVYFVEDGTVIYDKPEGLERYGIEGWYTDSQLTNATVPGFGTASGAELYVRWQLEEKSITINPMNGDSPYEITVYLNPDKNELDLPLWSGHEIVGWYTDRECTGEAVSLDFDSVTDGTTYYAKWSK